MEQRDINTLTETALNVYGAETDTRELEKRSIRAEIFRLKEVIRTYQGALQSCRPFDQAWHETMNSLQETRQKVEALKYYLDHMGA